MVPRHGHYIVAAAMVLLIVPAVFTQTVVAGKHVAYAAIGIIVNNPQFKKELAAARAETHAALGLQALGQAGQAPMAEDVFKNVRVLKGIPVDEFMDTMEMFAASLSFNCVNCHTLSTCRRWAAPSALRR
jgi:hypothetical protein